VEAEYLRDRAVPDFEWNQFDEPSRPRPLAVGVREARVALVSTAGAYLPATQEPFVLRSPLGDDSFRVIPGEATRDEISLAHVGYDIRRAAEDLDTVFPLNLLRDFAAQEMIGSVAPRHAAFMGYIPKTARLLTEIGPEVARIFRDDHVDLAILVPA